RNAASDARLVKLKSTEGRPAVDQLASYVNIFLKKVARQTNSVRFSFGQITCKITENVVNAHAASGKVSHETISLLWATHPLSVKIEDPNSPCQWNKFARVASSLRPSSEWVQCAVLLSNSTFSWFGGECDYFRNFVLFSEQRRKLMSSR